MQIVGASLPVRLSSGPRACRGGSRFRSENRLQAGSYTDHLTAFLSTSEGGVHCIDTAKSSPENRRTRPSRWGQPGVWGRTTRTGTTRWSSRLLEPARVRPRAERSFRSPVSAFRRHFRSGSGAGGEFGEFTAGGGPGGFPARDGSTGLT